MNGTKAIRTIGAVALSAAVGMGASGAAHAIMIDGSKVSVTYAKETLPDAGKVIVGGVTHYLLGHDVMIAGPTKIAGLAGDRYFITYTLDGMSFGSITPDFDSGKFRKATGGAAKDTSVTYRLATTEAVVADEDIISFAFRLAVSAQGGTITRTIVNEALPSAAKRSETHRASVLVKSALKETVEVPDAMTAKAVSNFTNFGAIGSSPVLIATLGSLRVEVMTGEGPADNAANPVTIPTDTRYRDAGSDQADGEEVMLSDIMVGSASSDADADKMESTATVAGDITFVKKFGFVTDCSVSISISDIRKMATAPATGYTDEIEPQLISDFTDAALTLCLTVDGETAIPSTEYMVTTKYGKVATSAFGPQGTTQTIGVIKRDGTTVHIPYLTTYMGYNQRLVMRNLGTREVTYTVAFTTEDGVMADPESVTGMLMAGEYKTMKVGDMTTLSGGSRAAATVTSNAALGTLEVATTLVNLGDRSTDTETHLGR